MKRKEFKSKRMRPRNDWTAKRKCLTVERRMSGEESDTEQVDTELKSEAVVAAHNL